MNSKYLIVNRKNRSEYWSKLDIEVYNLIKEKKVAFNHELQLCLETRYGDYDVGKSIEFLSHKAPFIHLEVIEEDISGSHYKFFYRKKEKPELIKNALNQKKKLLKIFNSSTFQKEGNWVHREFYPRVLQKEGFIIESIGTSKYDLVEIDSDIDLILTPIPLTKSKIFVEIKNSLTSYSKKDLYKFFNNLRKFNLDIIPVVISRKLYDFPKQLLTKYGGDYIEMNKVLIRQNLSEQSKQYNNLIADVLRVIPEKIIQPDIKKKINVLKGLKEGINFSKLDYFSEDSNSEEYITESDELW